MHIKELIHKTTAFTLAEMMVILTIMSVVMAATLPIITAPDSAVLSGDASDSEEYWTYKDYGSSEWLYYQEDLKAVTTPNFVAINYTPTSAVDTASLYVNSNSDNPNASQILFTVSPDNKTVYNAGRLFMGGKADDAYNIALGANTLANVGNNDKKNVAIGTLAMYSANTSSSRQNSVAIGPRTLYLNTPSYTVAIGGDALSAKKASTAERTVAVGYFAGAMNSGTMKRSVHIGYMAGYTDDENHEEEDNINIGYQAGALSKGNRVINIGTYAGLYSNDVYNNNQKDSSSEYINIGYYAGSMPYDITYDANWQNSYSSRHIAIGNRALSSHFAGVSDTIAIGSWAGSGIKGDSKESIFIGDLAGGYLTQGNPQDRIVAIGARAAFNNAGTAVAIGAHAGSCSGIGCSYAGNGRNAKHNDDKMLNEVAIGHMAGTTDVADSGSYGNIFIGNRSGGRMNSIRRGPLVNSICLGHNSCAMTNYAMYSLLIGEYANADLRGLTSSNNKLASFSIITTEWPTDRYSYLAFDPIYESLFGSVVHTLDRKADLWGQMIIAPSGLHYDKSSIVFEARTVYAPSAQPLTYSDKRIKKNIKPLKYSLKELRGVNVYEYNYLDDLNNRKIGVMAQDLLKIIPEAVHKDGKGYYTINPDWVFYPIINAIKELDNTVETCKTTIISYAKEYQILLTRVQTLEKEQKQIEKERKSLERQINRAYRKAEKMEKSV